jgi:hypothetical protein
MNAKDSVRGKSSGALAQPPASTSAQQHKEATISFGFFMAGLSQLTTGGRGAVQILPQIVEDFLYDQA